MCSYSTNQTYLTSFALQVELLQVNIHVLKSSYILLNDIDGSVSQLLYQLSIPTAGGLLVPDEYHSKNHIQYDSCQYFIKKCCYILVMEINIVLIQSHDCLFRIGWFFYFVLFHQPFNVYFRLYTFKVLIWGITEVTHISKMHMWFSKS